MKYTDFMKKVKKENNEMSILIDLHDLETHKEGNGCHVVDPRSQKIDGVWKVTPIAWTNSQIYVVCPFCGKIHVHGAGGGKYTGSRLAHCTDEAVSQYEVDYVIA